MGTTTLGIPYPESTDLVKDGATDMQALAEAANDLYGVVHIETASFSASAAVNVNDVFSATYDNYLIMFFASGSNANLNFRVRASGTDLTTSTYLQTASSATTDTKVIVGETADRNSGYFMFIERPFASTYTMLQTYGSLLRSTPLMKHASALAAINNTTSYDGFTYYPDTGTLTGSYSVYGLRN